MQGHLKVVLPVATATAIVWEDWVTGEDAQIAEVIAQAVEDNDVGGYQQDVARQGALGLVELVEIRPGNE